MFNCLHCTACVIQSHRVIENIFPRRSLLCTLSVNVTGLLIYTHSCALIMGLAHCSSSQAGIIQAQGYLIILAGDFNQVLPIENKQMFSHYSTGINRNLTHEFPNYTAPFWKSVGIQTLSVIQYTVSFG